MDFYELLIYLLFILFFLISHYLRRRKMAMRQAEISLAAARSVSADSAVSASSAAGTLRAKSAYRPLEGAQATPEAFKLLKAEGQKSAYRKQFKSRPGLQQAVVSMVVLGACRADAPYENGH